MGRARDTSGKLMNLALSSAESELSRTRVIDVALLETRRGFRRVSGASWKSPRLET